MTGARATALVAGRELRESFRRRSLWIVFAILFIGSSAAMILPDALDRGTSTYHVALVSGTGAADTQGFETALRSYTGALNSGVTFTSVPTERRARALVDDGDADVAVVFGDPPRVVVRAGENDP